MCLLKNEPVFGLFFFFSFFVSFFISLMETIFVEPESWFVFLFLVICFVFFVRKGWSSEWDKNDGWTMTAGWYTVDLPRGHSRCAFSSAFDDRVFFSSLYKQFQIVEAFCSEKPHGHAIAHCVVYFIYVWVLRSLEFHCWKGSLFRTAR